MLSQYGSSYPVYVYDENSNLYQYVNAYKAYLQESGVTSASAMLISYNQLYNIGTNHGNPNWLYNITYYTGFARDDALGVWIVHEQGRLECGSYGFDSYDIVVDDNYGVRPVITISTSEIQQ